MLIDHAGDTSVLAQKRFGRTCMMEAALWFHTKAVNILLNKRADTKYALDLESYEGIVVYTLLAYGNAHPGWTRLVAKCQK